MRYRGQGITYDDVLLVPQYSEIDSRQDIDIRSNYLGENRIPIISAPMDYVTGYDMARTLSKLGAYGIVNRFTPDQWGINTWPTYEPEEISSSIYGLAIGATQSPYTNIRIEEERPHSVCIDVAHGDHSKVAHQISTVKENFPDIKVIAGNVATSEGFLRLQGWGADAIRVGIGAGSACSTRENTGVGVPQLTAVIECANVATTAAVIADGGIESPGDIVKALAAGADAVMLGKMLAGHDECPGEIISMYDTYVDATGIVQYKKKYRGQSIFGSNGSRGAPEGVEGFVPYRGPVQTTINQLTHYIRSGMSYVGARNIQELREKAEFIQVSPATLAENKTRLYNG